MLLILTSRNAFPDDVTGKVAIDPIPENSSWKANHSGANSESIFYIQIDDRLREKISIRDSAIVKDLDTAQSHVVKIYLNGKRIESFRFTFKEYDSNQLKLRYNPFHGTWSLSRMGGKPEPSSERVTGETRSIKTIHVFVALCDNEKQGIIPVPQILGNGNDPQNNLYWGALYGIKTYFKRDSDWKLVTSAENPNPFVLERCVFRHKTETVYMVADAYRGAEIKVAIQDLFSAAAGNRKETLSIEGKRLNLYGSADILAYIGHNGLMDFNITLPEHHDDATRSVIVLACKSKPYFGESLSRLKAKSLLLTTGFMSPEAYTLQAALSASITGEDSAEIRKRAAIAYDKYQKCGLKGALNLFYSE
jgi:hypothetical protein